MCARKAGVSTNITVDTRYSKGKNVLDEVPYRFTRCREPSLFHDRELIDLPDLNPMIQHYFVFDLDPLSDKKNSPKNGLFWLLFTEFPYREAGGGGWDRDITFRTLTEASHAPEATVRLSGDRERDITYLGGGITGPGDKGPVVRGQGEGHHVPWQRHHRPRRQRSGCQGTEKGT
jgi:hypothetical protein